MKLADLNPKLTALREASTRISDNLVQLELDSDRQLLEATKLAGASAAAWSAASATLTELWRQKALLEELLERAEKLRRARRADELLALLEDASIELGSAEVPLAERSLLSGSRVAQRCSPDALLASMSASFDEVKETVAHIGGAWERLVPQIDDARTLLQEAAAIAAELGEPGLCDLESAAQTLDALSARVTTDPVSVSAEDVDRLLRDLRAIHDELQGAAAMKRRFAATIDNAQELLDQLQTAVRTARAAHDELLVKISSPAAAAPEAAEGLGSELAAIAELADRGSWSEARRALTAWTELVEGRLQDARQALDANRAPLEERNRLRAMLEAYQVKAKRLSVLEDPTLEDIFTRAREALYTAPTNLALATELVRSYQQAVTEPQPTPEAMP
jgi:hypothetical protein